MLICTPTSDAGGLDAKIHNHFGSAPYFTLYNTETEEIQIIENRNSHHSHGTCHPMNQLKKYKIDVVLCNGMGRRAIEALNYEQLIRYCIPCLIIFFNRKNFLYRIDKHAIYLS